MFQAMEMTELMPHEDPELQGYVHINRFSRKARRDPGYARFLADLDDVHRGEFSGHINGRSLDPDNPEDRRTYVKFFLMHNYREVFKRFAATAGNEWSLVNSDLLNRELEAMLPHYQEPVWMPFCSKATFSDLRKHRPGRVEGIAQIMQEIPMGGQYPQGSWKEWFWEYQNKKYGERIDWFLEQRINDDLGFFSNLATELAQSYFYTWAHLMSSQLMAATGWNAALFEQTTIKTFSGTNVGQGTIGTDAFTLANLSTYIQDLAGAHAGFRSVRDIPFPNRATHVIVGSALEGEAWRIMRSPELRSTEAKYPTLNYVRSLNLEIVVDPMIDVICTTNGASGEPFRKTMWCVCNATSVVKCCETSDLAGFIGPQLFQLDPLSGVAFGNDSEAMKVRMFKGATPKDPRVGKVSNGQAA